jgi:hypothetical protein
MQKERDTYFRVIVLTPLALDLGIPSHISVEFEPCHRDPRQKRK